MSTLPFSATRPVHIGRVGLAARDSAKLADYYSDLLGLEQISRDGETVTLGAAGRPLLVIEGDKALQPDDPRIAGLFHTAFLFPERADLGRWIKRAAEKSIKLDGASDHIVSEALYLTDPEGNGIEIYADRPHESWKWTNGLVAMTTERLDMRAVVDSIPANRPDWKGAPENTVIGHVHLRVGDAQAAEEWWTGEMRFDTVARYGGAASFLSTGGYHHHIGANHWQSRGAGPRQPGRSGLAWVELLSQRDTAPKTARDPWGTEIRLVPAS
jgi:catechol 2,3-dioxygenase